MNYVISLWCYQWSQPRKINFDIAKSYSLTLVNIYVY